MLIKTSKDIASSEITPENVYRNRREFMKTGFHTALGLAGASMLPFNSAFGKGDDLRAAMPADMQLEKSAHWWGEKFSGRTFAPKSGPFTTDEALTPYGDVTKYNNFYEFGTDKTDPASYSKDFKTDPWSVAIEGEVEKPGVYTLEDILKPHALEERVYRLRCVEAWSMVIPWVGFPLADLVKRFNPTSKAKYLEFVTLHDPDSMPGQRSRFSTIDWPYREGLRMDEAVNPLTLLAVGLYGNVLPPQSGAPIRLVVPWKYGFKSIKSIVKIRFREDKPATTWNDLAPNEYGFFANVNPQVSHPRWSQASERRLPSSLFNPRRRDTELFNGYGEQVAHLYAGMDLRKNY